MRGGGAKLNGQKIEDEMYELQESDFDGEGKLKLSAGKKKHGIVKRG